MKHSLLLLSAAVMLGSCGKSGYPTRDSSVHTGTVIIANCGGAVVQLTDGSSFGQNGWQSPMAASAGPIDHVFKVANPCTWGGAKANSAIRFKFVPPAPQTCALCKIYVLAPDTAYSIQVIR